MAATTFESIMTQLKKKEYRPVYLLQGEEPYFIDLISDYIAEHVLTPDEQEFDRHILYGKDSSAEKLLTYARQFPIVAKHSVVILREAQEMRPSPNRPAIAELEKLASYFAKPPEKTILVICYKYGTVDGRKAFVKDIGKNGVLFESKKLYENKLPDWIINCVKERHYSIDPAAASIMADYLGSDLSKIVGQIEKLLVALPKGVKQIKPADVEKNIGISNEYSIFELQNALGTRNILKANRIINYYAANPKANPIQMVIPVLYSYFLKLLKYHFLENKNTAASALGIPPFKLGEFIAATQRYSTYKTVEIMALLRDADIKSKGGGGNNISDGDIMKELVFKILH
ncbi:MAG: DNA polymerase III subunit delta [Bacteroidales bacterium]|jgi:DNA polymerase-3 subunit delta|nr:DNA polymerase III subunit delta [Bacteroidales bacterium]